MGAEHERRKRKNHFAERIASTNAKVLFENFDSTEEARANQSSI